MQSAKTDPPDLSKLRVTLLSGKTFGTFTDLLRHPFKLLQLFRRDVLERTFDECGVPAKERDKHFPSFISQRHCSDSPIGATLDTADDGTVQANTEACRIFQCNFADALAQQVSRLKSLTREKVKPVPAVDIRHIALGADLVVVAEVQRGVNPPYATHHNQIYVRRGQEPGPSIRPNCGHCFLLRTPISAADFSPISVWLAGLGL
jgi:hypothetical protein